MLPIRFFIWDFCWLPKFFSTFLSSPRRSWTEALKATSVARLWGMLTLVSSSATLQQSSYTAWSTLEYETGVVKLHFRYAFNVSTNSVMHFTNSSRWYHISCRSDGLMSEAGRIISHTETLTPTLLAEEKRTCLFADGRLCFWTCLFPIARVFRGKQLLSVSKLGVFDAVAGCPFNPCAICILVAVLALNISVVHSARKIVVREASFSQAPTVRFGFCTTRTKNISTANQVPKDQLGWNLLLTTFSITFVLIQDIKCVRCLFSSDTRYCRVASHSVRLRAIQTSKIASRWSVDQRNNDD